MKVATHLTALSLLLACGARTLPTGVACNSNEVDCAGTCVAVWSDPDNCGSCGNVCIQSTVCFDGACTTSCGGGTLQCGQSCVDTNIDRDNCGACGATCPSGEACVAGACSSTCVDEQTLCVVDGGAAYCATTASDNKNCGTCGNTCASELACVNAVCSSTCAAGQSSAPMHIAPALSVNAPARTPGAGTRVWTSKPTRRTAALAARPARVRAR